MKLVGLEGVRKKALDAVRFTKPAQVSILLRKHRALTAADSNGAMNVWVDDQGRYRAEFMRYCLTLAKWRGNKKTRLTEWLKIWMPKMQSK